MHKKASKGRYLKKYYRESSHFCTRHIVMTCSTESLSIIKTFQMAFVIERKRKCLRMDRHQAHDYIPRVFRSGDKKYENEALQCQNHFTFSYQQTMVICLHTVFLKMHILEMKF